MAFTAAITSIELFPISGGSFSVGDAVVIRGVN